MIITPDALGMIIAVVLKKLKVFFRDFGK